MVPIFLTLLISGIHTPTSTAQASASAVSEFSERFKQKQQMRKDMETGILKFNLKPSSVRVIFCFMLPIPQRAFAYLQAHIIHAPPCFLYLVCDPTMFKLCSR